MLSCFAPLSSRAPARIGHSPEGRARVQDDTPGMRPVLLLAAAVLMTACDAARPPAAPAPAVTVTVEGRVEDDQGRGLPDVWVRLFDTTRLSGHVDNRGCGTYHPQASLHTGPDGRFSGALPFQPNEASVSGNGQWLEFPHEALPVTPGASLVVKVRAIPHTTRSGEVVDADGRPVSKARITPQSGAYYGVVTGEDGRFQLEVAEPPPDSYRVRRMGFRPLLVTADALQHVVLRQRRPIAKVTVLEPSTHEPVTRLVKVAFWQAGERLSFCTAGSPGETGEPETGVCWLDAEPGLVEVRLDGTTVKQVTVGGADLSLALTAPPVAPPDEDPH